MGALNEVEITQATVEALVNSCRRWKALAEASDKLLLQAQNRIAELEHRPVLTVSVDLLKEVLL